MDTIFQWARENQFRRVLAGVTKVNSRALKFYIKYGFSVLSESAVDHPDGVYLVKEILQE
jgi:ribosomal protein S18 acetylase RimI-like enzyme